ncbi:MAG: hypothetical protein KDI36_14865 [Pseudomonadales bacterium]|nr:hypothetical protein [Pseudomonadales bacterium]
MLKDMALKMRDSAVARTIVGWLMFGIWLGWVIWGFWYYQYRFYDQWYSFAGEQLMEVPAPARGELTVAHFIDSACPCTRFSIPHIEDLENSADFNSMRVRSLKVEMGSLVSADFGNLVPASPSVAIWRADGTLKYFGPYSSGAICGEGEDLVLRALKASDETQWLNQEAVGCLCAWQASNGE